MFQIVCDPKHVGVILKDIDFNNVRGKAEINLARVSTMLGRSEVT